MDARFSEGRDRGYVDLTSDRRAAEVVAAHDACALQVAMGMLRTVDYDVPDGAAGFTTHSFQEPVYILADDRTSDATIFTDPTLREEMDGEFIDYGWNTGLFRPQPDEPLRVTLLYVADWWTDATRTTRTAHVSVRFPYPEVLPLMLLTEGAPAMNLVYAPQIGITRAMLAEGEDLAEWAESIPERIKGVWILQVPAGDLESTLASAERLAELAAQTTPQGGLVRDN